jgi:putative hydrolase of HD superfamily
MFGEVDRATCHPDGRPEADTTHTVMLGLLTMTVAPQSVVDLDIGLAVQFALVHDLVEAYAGDTVSINLDAEGRQAKDEREAAALTVIQAALPNGVIPALIVRYEQQEEPEARFVRYLDKIAPKLTHVLNQGTALAGIGIDHTAMRASHAKQGLALREQYPEFGHLAWLFDQACGEAERCLRGRI